MGFVNRSKTSRIQKAAWFDVRMSTLTGNEPVRPDELRFLDFARNDTQRAMLIAAVHTCWLPVRLSIQTA